MNDPIHIAITRTVKPGCEAAFEQALHDFVQRSLTLPGQMGVHIIRPARGSDSHVYGIIRKFSNRDALTAFRTSPEYLEWNQFALGLTEGSGHVEELFGLESWFTLPGQPLHPLPQWKMAIATYLGVLPVVMFLNLTFGPLIRSWDFISKNVVFNACMVVLLTWVVMPFVTRALRRWLHSN